MTTSANLNTRTFIAAADFRTKQFYAMKVNTLGQCMLPTGAGDPIVGVLQNNPNLGEAATVAVGGRTKWVAGGAINAGQSVQTAADGRAAAASTGYAVGYSCESAVSVSGQIIEVDLLHMGTAVLITPTEGDGASADEPRNSRGETQKEQDEREAQEDADADLPAEERAVRMREREQVRLNPHLKEEFEARWKERDEMIAAQREQAAKEAAHEEERAAARREKTLAAMTPAQREAHEKAEQEAKDHPKPRRGPKYG